MDRKKQILRPIAYKFGLFLSIVIIGSLVIEPLISPKIILSILSLSATLAVFIIGIKKFKTTNGNIISLTDSIKTGLAIALIGSLIAAAYTYFHLTFFYEPVDGNSYNYTVLIIRTLSVGLIISLLVGLIIKNES